LGQVGKARQGCGEGKKLNTHVKGPIVEFRSLLSQTDSINMTVFHDAGVNRFFLAQTELN
jgi:hypothetical protein